MGYHFKGRSSKQLGGLFGPWSESEIRSTLNAAKEYIKVANYSAARNSLDGAMPEIHSMVYKGGSAATTAQTLLIDWQRTDSDLKQSIASGRPQVGVSPPMTTMEVIKFLNSPGGAAAKTAVGIGIEAAYGKTARDAVDGGLTAAEAAAKCAEKPITCWWEGFNYQQKIVMVGLGTVMIGAPILFYFGGFIKMFGNMANKRTSR